MALDYVIGAPLMLQLGSFQFGINSAAYQDLARGTEWRWPAQDRFGLYPALQFIGPGTETISLTGLIYPEWRGGLNQLSDLRALGETGTPQSLIDGRGYIMGRWVIERVEEKQSVFAAAGVPRRQEFTLQIRRIDDAIAIGSLVVPPLASSAVTTPAIPTASTTPVTQVTGLSNSVVLASQGMSSKITKDLTSVTSAVRSITSVSASATGAVRRMLDSAGEMQFAANRVLAVVGRSPVHSTAVAQAKSLAGKAASILMSAQSAAAVLRNITSKLEGMPSPNTGAISACRSAATTADGLASMCRQTQSEARKIGD